MERQLTRSFFLLLPFLLSALACAPPAGAQAPFETSTAALELTFPRTDRELARYWQAGHGFAISWQTPFYAGVLELHAEWLPLSPRQEQLPSLNNLLTTAGWLWPVRIGPAATLLAGASLGNNFMYRRSAGPLDGPESEFTASLDARFRYRLSDSFSMGLSVRRARVYTWNRITFTHAGVGLQYHFDNPPRLIRFLQ